MSCTKCGGRGYIEDIILRDRAHRFGQPRTVLRQCCDLRAYSRRVSELYGRGKAFDDQILGEIRRSVHEALHNPRRYHPLPTRQVRVTVLVDEPAQVIRFPVERVDPNPLRSPFDVLGLVIRMDEYRARRNH